MQLQRAHIISHLAGSGTRGANDIEQDAQGLQILVQRATACGVPSALSSPILAHMSGLARGCLEVRVAMCSHGPPQLAKAVQRQGIRDGNFSAPDNFLRVC